MPAPLNPATIALVKATVPALEAHGLDITRRMYERLFQNPEIRDLFNQPHHGETGSQPKALAAAVLAYAQNIDNLGALAPAVERHRAASVNEVDFWGGIGAAIGQAACGGIAVRVSSSRVDVRPAMPSICM